MRKLRDMHSAVQGHTAQALLCPPVLGYSPLVHRTTSSPRMWTSQSLGVCGGAAGVMGSEGIHRGTGVSRPGVHARHLLKEVSLELKFSDQEGRIIPKPSGSGLCRTSVGAVRAADRGDQFWNDIWYKFLVTEVAPNSGCVPWFLMKNLYHLTQARPCARSWRAAQA